MQLLEAKRELQKDKENDRLARQKVKEEIERDRSEGRSGKIYFSCELLHDI